MFGFGTPKEVKATLTALDEVQRRLSAKAAGPGHAAVALAVDQARMLAKSQAADTVASIRENGWSPGDLALLLVSKRASALAGSGHYHTYRGVPDPTGRGLQRVFELAGEEMVAGGFITEAEHRQDLADLKRQMAEVG